MDTYQIEIIEPRAKKLLDDMADMDLITVQLLGNGVKTKSKASIRDLFGKGQSGDQNGSDNDRIDKVLSEIAALPIEGDAEEFSGADHDRVLYLDK